MDYHHLARYYNRLLILTFPPPPNLDIIIEQVFGQNPIRNMLTKKHHYFYLLLIAIAACAYLFYPTHVAHDIVDENSPVSLHLIADGLSDPLLLTEPPDQSGRLFVAEKGGRIKIIKNGKTEPQPFLDLSTKVSQASEQGLLGLAFHPKYSENGRFFVDYTDLNGDTKIEEYRADPPSSDRVDSSNGRLVLFYKQPFKNHNGGQLLFGPDGYLYIPSGDGGSAGDPQKNAQNLNSFLGKILRIDIDQNTGSGFDPGPSYGIPSDNPFLSRPDARPEIWAYGMRNPWRCSFDRGASQQLFCADVGQNKIEEVDIIVRGGNYGWPIFEGKSCYQPPCNEPGHEQGMIMPISQYDHDSGISVTGGFVYRGKVLPELAGKYLFGDFGSGTVWMIPADTAENGKFIEPAKLIQSEASISSFGDDRSGELYLVDFSGKIYKFVPRFGK